MALSIGVLAVQELLNACRRFLLRHQCRDGSWSDWDLPPGPSDSWTTAYVGYQLAAAPSEPVSVPSAAARAAAWLSQREFASGGWGYNDRVGPDADSTAHALLLLSSQQMGPFAAGYECLVGFQKSDGGFSTYLGDQGLGSWGVSHPDVTAVAARAILSIPQAAAAGLPVRDRAAVIERALDYIARHRNPEGTWDSFWWSSPLYATAAALSLLSATGSPVAAEPTCSSLSRIHAENPFERGLCLDCYLHVLSDPRGRQSAPLVKALISEQLPDGSWSSLPILRLTNRDCFDPARHDGAGPLFADPKRLFTSATVFGALSGFVRRSRVPRRLGAARVSASGE